MAYQDTQSYKDAYGRIIGNNRPEGGTWDQGNTSSKLSQYGDTFANLFQTLVGRAPGEQEFGQFFGQVVPDVLQGAGLSGTSNTELNNLTREFIGNTFQQQAQDVAGQKLQAQQGEANRLADLFRTQGRQAISDTESGLLDYQQKLFERLRPNLITSLQAQGLLNTGGLNQAVAGAQADIGTAAQGALMDARLQNEQQANAIAYGGQAAPYQYQQGNIMNSVPYLQQQAQGGLQNNFQTMMSNLNFQNQMALQNNAARLQQEMQPSFLRTFGQTAASSLGSNFNIPSYLSAMQGGKTSAPGATA